jgi:hypothetical protein
MQLFSLQQGMTELEFIEQFDRTGGEAALGSLVLRELAKMPQIRHF